MPPRLRRVLAADASDTDQMTEVATGASTVFGCAAPPYHRWATDFPPLGAALLSAAQRSGAGYVMLGNLYGYGQVDGPMTEDLPMAPNTRKGRIRTQLWLAAKSAYEEGRVRVTEVRASDFIGPGAVSVITQVLIPNVSVGKTASVPADLDAPHSWTIITDAACALVAAARHENPWGRAWHVPTNPPLSVRELAERYAELAGLSDPEDHLYWRLLDALGYAPDAEKVADPWRQLGRTDLTPAVIQDRQETYLSHFLG